MHVVQNLKIFNDFVIGTSKVAEPYKLGERSTDVMLEILNLDKKEAIAIDEISNQEFSEVIKLDSIFFGFLLPTPINCRKGSFFPFCGLSYYNRTVVSITDSDDDCSLIHDNYLCLSSC